MTISKKNSGPETERAPSANADPNPKPKSSPSSQSQSSANKDVAPEGNGTVATKPTAAQSVAPPQLSKEESAELQRRATKSKHLQASFGEIVGLLMSSPHLKNLPLSSLNQMVVPAIVAEQFMIAEARSKESGFLTPIAAVLWARVSEEVDQRLSENTGKPVKLDPNDWHSGDIPWLILAAGDQRVIKTLLQRVQKTVLKDRPLKFRSPNKGDKAVAPTTPPN